MNEEICCVTNKYKTAKKEWENDDCDFLQALYSVYKKLVQFFFHAYLLPCLKVVSATFLLVCFLSLNETTC